MSIVTLENHVAAVSDMIGLVGRHRDLTWELTKREITDRYAGQMLGALWAIGHPLLMMAIYTFVFAYILKTRIGGTHDMPLDYTAYLLSGLIAWTSFQESMSKSSGVIIANGNLVKQVVFPIEILPVKGVLAAMVTQVIALVILAAYILLSHGSLPWTWVLVVPLLACQFLAMTGVAYILSSLGTYFRDIKDIVQVGCTAGVYFMPVFYVPEWVPERVRPVLWLNPFSYLAWCFQDACYFGRFEHPVAWALFPLGSIAICYVGFRLFRKLKTCFGSVL